MPDFERVLRQAELDRADASNARIVKAYFDGLDRARKEAAVIAFVIGVLCVIGHL